jgi:hypothetical protein
MKRMPGISARLLSTTAEQDKQTYRARRRCGRSRARNQPVSCKHCRTVRSRTLKEEADPDWRQVEVAAPDNSLAVAHFGKFFIYSVRNVRTSGRTLSAVCATLLVSGEASHRGTKPNAFSASSA